MLKGTNVGNFGKQMEITHIFLADNTLLFYQAYVNSLLMLKYIFLCFQAVFSLKINLNESELVGIGTTNNGHFPSRVLGYKANQLPTKYLDMPLGAKFKDGSSWEPIIDIFENWPVR